MRIVSINLVVFNGEKYIRHFLASVKEQTYPHASIEVNILDNGSSDATKQIIGEAKAGFANFAGFKLIESEKNLGMWPGQEELLKHTAGEVMVCAAVDIIFEKDFVANAVKEMDGDPKIGALQSKTYRWELKNGEVVKTKEIDTLGFEIYKSRRVVNIAHGVKDEGQFNKKTEIFGVEGAAPIFRRSAFEDLRVAGEIADHEYFWYGDDLDLAWRLNLFGWKQYFVPEIIAWHDRQTTKSARKSFLDYFRRVKIRRQIPIKKRRLDWRNTRFTIVKNDYIINVLKDLPRILAREISVLGYALLFEPGVLKEIPIFLARLPKIIRKRKAVMKKAKVSPAEIRKWFKNG